MYFHGFVAVALFDREATVEVHPAGRTWVALSKDPGRRVHDLHIYRLEGDFPFVGDIATFCLPPWPVEGRPARTA